MSQFTRFRLRLARLGPYPSLAGEGHWLTGTVVLIAAYASSLLIVERLFRLLKPNLLRLRWIERGWSRWRWARARASRWFGGDRRVQERGPVKPDA
jgi:hypothetical protein